MYTSSRDMPIPPEELVEELPRLADERVALLVLVEAGRLADEHQLGLRVPDAEDDLGAALGKARSACSRRPRPRTASSSVPAATAPAATTARRWTAEGGLLGGAVSREHGELLAHVRGVAVGAADRFPVADELLEVRLALHAHVLVDRHRRESLGKMRTLGATLRPARYPLRNWSFLVENDPDRRLRPSRLRCRRTAAGAWLRADRGRSRARPALRARPGDRGGCRDGIPTGPWIAHTSGATPLSALDPHERRFGLHPLQSFTRARGPEQLDGAYAAVTAETDEAREVGFWLARELGLEPFALDDSERALYHAGAVVASNFLVTLHQAAADLVEAAGAPPEALVPLMRRVIENDFELTGPIERGDWETVEAHLAAIRERRPELEPLYRALADATAELAVP